MQLAFACAPATTAPRRRRQALSAAGCVTGCTRTADKSRAGGAGCQIAAFGDYTESDFEEFDEALTLQRRPFCGAAGCGRRLPWHRRTLRGPHQASGQGSRAEQDPALGALRSRLTKRTHCLRGLLNKFWLQLSFNRLICLSMLLDSHGHCAQARVTPDYLNLLYESR